MSADGQTPTIRDAHKDLTQSRILDAAIDLLRNEDLDALRFADIAKAAGVTERTIYRHFATREDLLKALWPRLQSRVGSPGFASTAMGLAEMPLALFPNFEREAGAVRASAFSKAGRELRQSVNEQRKESFRAAVRDARPDLKGAEFERMCATVQLLNSAFAWAVMKDFWGLDGPESGRASSDAIKILLGLAPAKPNASKKETKP